MSAYLITGETGAGKTTTARAVHERGYVVHDTDDPQISYRQGRGSDAGIYPTKDDPDWEDRYPWLWREEVIRKLISQASGEASVFFCGFPRNQKHFQNEFKRIFLLKITIETLEKRVRQRTEHDYGKDPYTMKRVKARMYKYQQEMTDLGATVSDATKPTSEVVDQILSHV